MPYMTLINQDCLSICHSFVGTSSSQFYIMISTHLLTNEMLLFLISTFISKCVSFPFSPFPLPLSFAAHPIFFLFHFFKTKSCFDLTKGFKNNYYCKLLFSCLITQGDTFVNFEMNFCLPLSPIIF